MNTIIIDKKEWDRFLEKLIIPFTIYAGIKDDLGYDYEIIGSDNINRITYNKPKPATPLKSFFLPVRENVTSPLHNEKPRIIIGVPNCDIEGLRLLDEIYMDKQYTDIFYRKRRENTLLISADCFGIEEHCHCLTYNIKPYASDTADLAIACIDDKVALRILSQKGEEFMKNNFSGEPASGDSLAESVEALHHKTELLLEERNNGLPGSEETARLVMTAGFESWKNFSRQCVSCGACTAICPTCSCFLLIDKPGFEKIKQMDACQYPGFERVAGGEDALFDLSHRFRNRYLCKYAWKQLKFASKACTGCGRCIDACIGKIDKNEIFTELAKM